MIWAIIASYVALVVGIGAWSSRRGTGTAEDYFLAGRSLGTVVLFMALFGTNVTAFGMLGFPGFAYREGVGVFGFFGASAAFVSPLLFILLGYPIWNIGKRNRFVTQAQMFRSRWDSRGVGVVLTVFPILYTFLYMGAGVIGGALAISEFAGIAYPFAALTVTGTAFVYTSLGGMRGTAWTNVLQAGLFLVFLVVAAAWIANALGGPSHLHQRLVTEAPQLLSQRDEGVLAPASWAFGFLLGPASVIAFPHMFHRLLAARNVKALRRSIHLYPWALILLFVPVTMLGLWGALEFPDLSGKATERVLPLLMLKHLPEWLAGIGLVAILAAVMSSLDAQLLTLSTIFAVDVFARGGRPSRWVGRIVLLVLAAVALAIALWQPATIVGISLYAFGGYTLLIPIFVAGFFWPRSTGKGVIVASVVGHGLWTAYHAGKFLGPAWDLDLPSPILPPIVWCLLIECGLLVGGSLLTRRPDSERVERFARPFA